MKVIYVVESSSSPGKSVDQIIFCLDESLLHIFDVYNDLKRQNIYFIVNSVVYIQILHWALSRGFHLDNVILDMDVEYKLFSLLPIENGTLSKHIVLLSSQIRIYDSKRFLWLVESADSPILSLLPRTDENQDLDVVPLIVATVTLGADLTKLTTSIVDAMTAFKDNLSTDHENLFEKLVEYLQSYCSLSNKCKMADEAKIQSWTNKQTQTLLKNVQVSASTSALRKVEGRCHARIGLMGNPSDGFGGKTISFLIENFSATVTIAEIPTGLPSIDSVSSGSSSSTESLLWTPPSIHIEPHPIHDKTVFRGMDDLYAHSSIHGYYGGVRLIQASCKMFAQRCASVSTIAHTWRSRQRKSIRISYETDIPRMVGLSGSSAIVVATFRALMEYYQVSLSDIALTPGELAQVILDVERSELGISAGLQDRVVQSVGGLVHMDFSCFTPASHTSSSASLSVSSDVSIANVSTVSANNSSSSGLFPSLLSPMKFMNRSATIAAQVSVNDTNDKNSNNSQTNPNPNPNKIVSQKTSAQQSTNSPITPNKTLKELVVNKDGTLSSTSVQSPGTPSVFPSKLLASNSIPSIQTGIYTSLNPTLLPPLYLAYNTVAGGDSGQVHSTVKERWAKRDPDLVAGMAALGKLADAAKDALESGKPNELAGLMAQNFSWRRKMYGDAVVGASNLKAIEIAEKCGLAAKFTGSGGALVCMNKTQAQWLDETAEEETRRMFAGIFFEFVRVRPVMI